MSFAGEVWTLNHETGVWDVEPFAPREVSEDQLKLLARIDQLYHDVDAALMEEPTPEIIANIKQRWSDLLDEVAATWSMEAQDAT